MRTTLKIVTALILAFLLLGCGEDDGMQPENLIDQVGFEGALPDGQTVIFESSYEVKSAPIVFSFKTNEDADGIIYQGNVATYIMNLKDLTREFEIYIRLPELKWSDVATAEFSSSEVYEEIYSFDKVKEVLAAGEKKINLVDFNYNKEDYGAVPDFIQVYYVPKGATSPFE